MGSASSKPSTKGTRRRRSSPELADQNQQNNHIFKAENEEKRERFVSIGLTNGDHNWKSRTNSKASLSSSLSQINSNYDRKLSKGSPQKELCISNNNNKHPLAWQISSEPSIGLLKNNFKIVKLKVGIDRKPTSLDEKSAAVLKYRTPHFRAFATVELPEMSSHQSVRIGWIQTCSSMKFINTYGTLGMTSWEFPEIVTGKFSMISDADGKQYPWYGSKHEVQTIHGPTPKQSISVHMNDNFFPQVTWYIPQSSFDRTARLSAVHRKQNFFTFLVLKDLNDESYHVLKAITWSMVINIEVKPDNPLGRRAKLLEPFEQRAPVVLSESCTIKPEPYALRPPNANNSQVLMWRPHSGTPKVVVPPEETTVDIDKYTLATKDHLRWLLTQLPEA